MANFTLAALLQSDDVSKLDKVNCPEGAREGPLGGNMQVTYIPLSKLLVNERNFFVVEDVQALADDIALHGLDNPLTVREIGDGTYRIVAGHRRRKALELLDCKAAPCIVKNYDGEDSELVALIQSNLTSRELTYYEKMEAVIRLEKALRSMKERGVELPGRLRDHLAEQAGESTSAVHRMTYIHKKLSPALLDALRREQIGESVADELAHSPKAVQKEFEKRLERGETIRAQDVKAVRDKPTASDEEIDAFLLRHIVSSRADAIYRALHDSHIPAAQQVSAVKEALHFHGCLVGFASDAVWFDLTSGGLEVKEPFRGKLSWAQIVQRLHGMVNSGQIAPPVDDSTPEEQTLRQLDAQMRQAVQEIAPPTEATAPLPAEAQVWHPYPAERPAEGQLVLTKSYNRYTRTNYAAYIYRAEGWYLPELPDDGLMTVDVRWWTAELPPEE